MVDSNNVFSDNAYKVMSEIATNEKVTQRELSKQLGLSLGSVNVLINKLVKEGLVKIEQVSKRQVFYMLTPAGMLEKANKTVSYLKAHYQAIYYMKEKIKNVLVELQGQYEVILVLLQEDEMSEILKVAVEEYHHRDKGAKIYFIDKYKYLKNQEIDKAVLIHIGAGEVAHTYEEKLGVDSINIVHKI